MRRPAAYIYAIFLLFVTVGCVHQFPTSVPADLKVRLVFDTSMDIYQEYEYTKTSNDAGDYDVRYILECYRKLKNGSYSTTSHARFVFTRDELDELDNEFTVSLDEGDYIIRAWTDYVDAGSQADKFYNTSDFSRIRLTSSASTHIGNNDFRQAYFGHQDVTVIRYGSITEPCSCTIPMIRPQTKVEFRATDLRKFVEKHSAQGRLSDYYVTIYYPVYMPSSFNVMADDDRGESNDSKVNCRFDSKIIQLDDDSALIGFDYVFVPENPHKVSMQVGVYAKDENNTQLSLSDEIMVPVLRNKCTIVTGSLLTQNPGGGVAVNPEFDGDINIIIP